MSLSSTAAVHLHDISFSYDSRGSQNPPLICIDDLQVERGERIFLHGPSGSGKTTLLGLIAGVLLPQKGSVAIFGQDLTRLSLSARDRYRGSEMGYIFQSFNLIPYLTVRQNIALPCQIHPARLARITGRSLDDEIRHIAGRLDLEAHLDRRVTLLSTGQQQRVAIARAVIGRPPLVIADEPTSALDQDRREQFLKLLLDVCNDGGSTLLFVSHERTLIHNFSREISIAGLNRSPAC
jgi:putative ABC transport system ATP-binding protein